MKATEKRRSRWRLASTAVLGVALVLGTIFVARLLLPAGTYDLKGATGARFYAILGVFLLGMFTQLMACIWGTLNALRLKHWRWALGFLVLSVLAFAVGLYYVVVLSLTLVASLVVTPRAIPHSLSTSDILWTLVIVAPGMSVFIYILRTRSRPGTVRTIATNEGLARVYSPERPELMLMIREWMNTSNWGESRAYLSIHPQIMSAEGEQLIQIAYATLTSEDERVVVRDHLEILQLVREYGVFDGYQRFVLSRWGS